MAGTNIDLSSVFTVDQSTTPIHDGNYPASTRPSGGAPNSGAVLSGGTALRGPYDYASGSAPVDSDYRTGTALGGTLDYSSGFARGTYLANTVGSAVWTSIDTPTEDISEVYIQFRARMPNSEHGFKFVKIFGKPNDPTGGANTTIGLDYTGIDSGGLIQLSYGDGTTTGNDTQNVIRLNGTSSNADLGRGFATAQINVPNGRFNSTDWGEGWHDYRIYFKFNSGTTSGNEVADGAWYLEIDGDVYADVGGLFNRNPDNSLHIDHIGLFGWTQGSGPEFTIDYDDVLISTGGFA